MTKFQRKYEELRRSTLKLVTRLDQIGASAEYKSVFASAEIHGVAYTGPTYSKELKEVKQRLADQ